MRRLVALVLIACLQGLPVAWAADVCRPLAPWGSPAPSAEGPSARATPAGASTELRDLDAPQAHHCDHLGAHLTSVPVRGEEGAPLARPAARAPQGPAPRSLSYAPLPRPPKA